jgi:hypothetical protein
VDDDVVELNRRVVDADLQEAEASGSFSDLNVVMVMLAVDVGLAQVDPAGCIGCRGEIEQQRYSKARNQNFPHV